MKISHCIDMMYGYTDFESRIEEARKFGADAVEFWKWSDKDTERICASGMSVSVFNLDSADPQLSYDLSRGILNSARADDLLYALWESIPIYRKLGASAMILLVGENAVPNADNCIKCLSAVKSVVEAENVNLVLEPLNNIDRPGYCMPYASQIFEILKEVDSPNIKMLYDIYHQNMMGDFSVEDILENIDMIGHFHVADCPGRHEPGSGRVDYVSILEKICASSYGGYIGLEYRATRADGETFDFIEQVRRNA